MLTPDHRRTATDELIAELERDNAKRRERDSILTNEVPKMRFAARSENGDVEVIVAWDGVMTSLHIGASTRGADPQLIAETVARTYARAQQNAASELANLLAGFRVPKTFIAQRLEERRTLETGVAGEPAVQRDTESGIRRGSDDASDDDDDFDLNDLRG